MEEQNTKYIPHAKVTTIHYISRGSVKIKDNFFTIEYGEDRQVDDTMNLEKERRALIDDCNNTVDKEISYLK